VYANNVKDQNWNVYITDSSNFLYLEKGFVMLPNSEGYAVVAGDRRKDIRKRLKIFLKLLSVSRKAKYITDTAEKCKGYKFDFATSDETFDMNDFLHGLRTSLTRNYLCLEGRKVLKNVLITPTIKKMGLEISTNWNWGSYVNSLKNGIFRAREDMLPGAGTYLFTDAVVEDYSIDFIQSPKLIVPKHFNGPVMDGPVRECANSQRNRKKRHAQLVKKEINRNPMGRTSLWHNKWNKILSRHKRDCFCALICFGAGDCGGDGGDSDDEILTPESIEDLEDSVNDLKTRMATKASKEELSNAVTQVSNQMIDLIADGQEEDAQARALLSARIDVVDENQVRISGSVRQNVDAIGVNRRAINRNSERLDANKNEINEIVYENGEREFVDESRDEALKDILSYIMELLIGDKITSFILHQNQQRILDFLYTWEDFAKKHGEKVLRVPVMGKGELGCVEKDPKFTETFVQFGDIIYPQKVVSQALDEFVNLLNQTKVPEYVEMAKKVNKTREKQKVQEALDNTIKEETVGPLLDLETKKIDIKGSGESLATKVMYAVVSIAVVVAILIALVIAWRIYAAKRAREEVVRAVTNRAQSSA